MCMRHTFPAPCAAELSAPDLYSVTHQRDAEDTMKAKMILQASITFLVLSIGSGVLPTGMGIAQAFQQPAAQLQPLHSTQNGVPEDFIFASNYTWLNHN